MAKPTCLILIVFLILSAADHGGGSDSDKDSDTDSVSGWANKPDLRARSLVLVKIWCLIIAFFGTFVSGVSPYFLKWNEGFLVLGTQFAGGVFLGTAMIHFLSDSNEKFEDLTEKEYPFAFMLASAGYVITMAADCVIAYYLVAGKKKRCVRDFEGGDELYTAISYPTTETKGDAWKALWTICLHKIFAAIAMGIALLRMLPARPLLSCTAYSFAFAVSTPIGVAIGIIIDATTEGRVADWIYAISMGLACGVFIYVSINLLFAKGYQPLKTVAVNTPVYRWLAVVLGVGVIAVVMIWDT